MCRWNSGEAKHHEQGLESNTGNIEHHEEIVGDDLWWFNEEQKENMVWQNLAKIIDDKLDDNKKINLCSPAVVRSKTMSGAESEPIIASRALQTWKEASQECETVMASQFW